VISFNIPIVVEGKYDKARLVSLVDSVIITTDGFGVFKSPEKRALIRKLGQKGLIILCDSDGGGKIIRSHLKGQLAGIKTYDLYIPQIAGKEKRKSAPSKEGFLGVEGVDNSVLLPILEHFAASHPELTSSGGCAVEKTPVTTVLMFELGLSGGNDSQARRDILAVKMGLPRGMNAKALTEALNMVSDADEVEKIAGELFCGGEEV
jgi:ribonuclease M5